MKIICQSCQSKYNVADEKVQGKVVKIRCRKCGATIVVNGAPAGSTGPVEAEPPQPAQPNRASADGVPWHVNVGEDDQRTMSLEELVHAFGAGVVTMDTFVWTEGMGDWKPIADVENVASAVARNAAAPPSTGRNAIASTPTSATGPDGGFGNEPPNLAARTAAPNDGSEADDEATRAFSAPVRNPFDGPTFSAPEAGFPGRTEPKRAALKRETRGRDMFASEIGLESGADDYAPGVQTSAPAAQHAEMAKAGAANDAAGRLTGERNENSVLFSLAVLTKTAEDRAPSSSDVHGSTSEDSGLIDLKALADKTESLRPPAIMADGSVFAPPMGSGSTLSAPLGGLGSPLGDDRPKSKVLVFLGAGVGALILLVVGIFIGVNVLGGNAAPATTASAVAAPASAEPEGAPSAVPAASVEPSAAAAASVAASAAKANKTSTPSGAPARPPQVKATTQPVPTPVGATTAAAGGAAAPPPPPPAAKKGDCGCNGDLMCLMKCSTH